MKELKGLNSNIIYLAIGNIGAFKIGRGVS